MSGSGSHTNISARNRASGPSTAVYNMVELLPIHVDPLEARLCQAVELRGEGDQVANVVLVAVLLVGCSMLPSLGCFGVTAVPRPQPGCLNDCVLGGDRVVVEVSATGEQVLQNLGGQLSHALVREVMDAQ